MMGWRMKNSFPGFGSNRHGQDARVTGVRLWALVAMMLVVSACSSSPKEPAKQSLPKPVTHVVICWLKDRGNVEHRQKLIEVSKKLGAIPGVMSVSAGEVLATGRPMAESSYDVGIVFRFESEAALRAYEVHPVHQRALRETMQPLVQRYVVFDFR
jgi:hypothetical protein